jgi:hypothetical protein
MILLTASVPFSDALCYQWNLFCRSAGVSPAPVKCCTSSRLGTYLIAGAGEDDPRSDRRTYDLQQRILLKGIQI